MSKISFVRENVFYGRLKADINHYFNENNLEKTGNRQLYSKAVILIFSALLVYIVLLSVQLPLVVAVLLCMLLGLLLAGIGFNIMHDAIHGSFSGKKWVNTVLALTLNALGGNAFIYKQKHLIHHNYTNVDGLDDDIAKSPLMRQCTSQRWVPAHRYQYLYIPLVYAVSGLAWITILDFTKYFTQKVYVTPMHKMKAGDHLLFWLSKLLYLFFYVALPVYCVGATAWFIGFFCMNATMGMTLAIVFQLAHVIENTSFETAGTGTKLMGNEWAVHQIQSSANFATSNRLITWYVGGLNYQIEHHLFPKISHIHYPAISKIVQQACNEYGLMYNSFPKMSNAIASHFRLMKKLGEKPAA